MADIDHAKRDEPLQLERVRTDADEPEKAVPKYDKTDYSGAHEKTDPKEIALVKKLDRYIMVRLETIPTPPSPILTLLDYSPCFGACIGSTISIETLSL